MTDYVAAAHERVLVYDGATGTSLQRAGLTLDDFGGPDFEGCNELLTLTRPDVIQGMHDRFLGAGCDVIETATFGAFAVPLGEYDIADRTDEINVAAAKIARDLASSHSTPDRPRWVAGSIGPGTKFASLGQISYALIFGLLVSTGVGVFFGAYPAVKASRLDPVAALGGR